MGKREQVALLNLSSWCLVMVERLFLAVPQGCLGFVIVYFLIILTIFDTLPIQYRHIEHMHEGVWLTKFDKMAAIRSKTIFPYMSFVYAWVVLLWATAFDRAM